VNGQPSQKFIKYFTKTGTIIHFILKGEKRSPELIGATRYYSSIYWLGLFESVCENWGKAATDPRDLIYTYVRKLLGIVDMDKSRRIKINYVEVSYAGVYDFAKQMILESNSLDIRVEVNNGGLNKEVLPSWVLNWSKCPDRHLKLTRKAISTRV
jgi:hypothetical protein